MRIQKILNFMERRLDYLLLKCDELGPNGWQVEEMCVLDAAMQLLNVEHAARIARNEDTNIAVTNADVQAAKRWHADVVANRRAEAQPQEEETTT